MSKISLEKSGIKNTNRTDEYERDVAIVGISCRFPGAGNYEEFWRNLAGDVCSVKEIPKERWDVSQYYSADFNQPNTSISKWCGLLSDIDCFDNQFFNISPREAKEMDPQHRLVLEESYRCIEDSGVNLKYLRDRGTAVFVGTMGVDYQYTLSASEVSNYSCLGSYSGILANRISHVYGFTGESQTVDAACAASLVALHNAKESLRAGDCEYALVGGVSLNFHPLKYIAFSKSRMLSPSGLCKTFDKDADGYVPGDGVGFVLLQRLDRASSQKNHIYGVIRGSAVNHSGSTTAITVPSVDSQCDVITRAISDGNVDPNLVSYVEAHGTGTSLGDPIEVEALTKAFRKMGANKDNYCNIGSVKTNIGHLESAAGVAGVVKVLMCMKHRKLPASLHINTINPMIDIKTSPFMICDELKDWYSGTESQPMIAGISSFGMGGVNSHVVVESFEVCSEDDNLRPLQHDRDGVAIYPFGISAKTPSGLKFLLEKWLDFTRSESFDELALADVSSTLMTGRQHFNYRVAILACDKRKLQKELECITNSFMDEQLLDSRECQIGKPVLVYLGDIIAEELSTWFELITSHGALKKIYSEYLDQAGLLSSNSRRFSKSNGHGQECEKEQCAQRFFMLLALTECLKEMGLSPSYMAGCEVGRLVAMVSAGIISISQAVCILGIEERKISEVVSRPDMPFYDDISQKYIYPVQVNEDYLKELISRLQVTEHDYEALASRCRILNESQFSFKNALLQWRTILELLSFDIDWLLNDFDNYGVLKALLLSSCLRQVAKKWKLADTYTIDNDAFNELLDLLSDGAISKSQVVGLLTSDSDTIYEDVSSSICKNQSSLDQEKPYSLLNEFNADLTIGELGLECWNAQSNLKNFRTSLADPLNDGGILITIGRASSIDLPNSISRVKLDRVPSQLTVLLARIWEMGVEVNWSSVFENKFSQVPLPTYVFDKERYPVSPDKSLYDRLEADGDIVEDDIAIVGMSGEFPQSPDLESFWENLVNKKDCIREIPNDRWNWKKIYGDAKEDKNQTHVKWGGFIDAFDQFDAPFFSLSRREASLMDPQQRKMLEAAWHTIEDAGYKASKLRGKKIGVFVGVSTTDYEDMIKKEGLHDAYVSTGVAKTILPNRISYLFDFSGPSEAIDTACSSSLVALHRASLAIRSGDCTSALVGGVSALLAPTWHIMFDKTGMLSSRGRCNSFDESADGYVRGEGFGMIYLKPLRKACEDNDNIYAILKSTATNHGGHAQSLTAPNPNAQAEVISSAYKKAGIDPISISYIEAHGTGTSLGDPIEINGLKKAFSDNSDTISVSRSSQSACGIGTVKTSIGHLEAAAGIAGVIKTVLALQNKTLPGLVNYKRKNPYIKLENSPFYFLDDTRDWKLDSGCQPLRRAGVSSFGFGGVNAHVVLEESENEDHFVSQSQSQSQSQALILISAKDADRLNAYIERWIVYVNKPRTKSIPLDDIAYTTHVGRDPMSYRLAVVTNSYQDLELKLKTILDKKRGKGIYIDHVINNKKKPLEDLPILIDLSGKDAIEQIASFWSQGFDDLVNQFPHSAHCRRAQIPSYPFDKNSYWFKRAISKKNGSSVLMNNSKYEVESMEETLRTKTTLAVDMRDEQDVVTLDVIDNHIAVITMSDIENRNMLSDSLVRGIDAKLAEVRKNSDLRSVVITGYKKIFCMGGTQRELMEIAEKKRTFSELSLIYQGLLKFELPIITAVQGHAFGAGLALGLFGDIVVMSEEGIYSSNFMKYGFTPGVGATFILKEKFGLNLANEMMFTASSFQGEELKHRGAGVIFRKNNQAVLDEAIAIARKLVEKPRSALEVLKKELGHRILRQLPDIIHSELLMHEKTFSNPEVIDNILAFFKKSDSMRVGSRSEAENIEVAIGSETILENTLSPKCRNHPVATEGSNKKIELRNLAPNNSDSEAVALSTNGNLPPTNLYEPTNGDIVCNNNSISRLSVRETLDEFTHIVGDVDEDSIKNDIISLLKKALHLDGPVDPNVPFNDIGVDSITAVELARGINRKYGLNLDSVALYDYATVNKMGRFLLGQLRTEIKSSGTSSAPVNALIESLSSLDNRGDHSVSGESSLIVDELIEVTKRVLHLNSDFDRKRTFFDLGVDSITAVEIVQSVNERYKTTLDSVSLYDYATFDKLAAHIRSSATKIGESWIIDPDESDTNNTTDNVDRDLISSDVYNAGLISENDKSSVVDELTVGIDGLSDSAVDDLIMQLSEGVRS